MTNRQLRALAAYTREIMDLLGLPHWKLILHRHRPEDAGEDAAGFCEVIYGQHTAGMWFDPNLPKELPGRQRYVVIHEVMHVHLDAPWNAWADPLRHDGLIAKAVYDAVNEGAVRTWEMTVDAIARAFCPYMPMIDWTAKPDREWIPNVKGADLIHVCSRQWDAADHPTPG